MSPANRRLMADLLLLSVAVAWGVTFVVVKESLASTPVFSFLFLRFGLAFLSLLPFAIMRRDLRRPGTWRAGLMLGLLYFLAFGTQTLGLLTVGASMSAFLTGLYVILVPLLVWLIFRRPPKPLVFYASVLALLGLWLLTSADLGSLRLGPGEGLTLLCALVFALHIIATDRFTRRYDPLSLVTVQLLAVTLLSLFASLAFEPSTWPGRFDSRLLFALLVTGILATSYALLVQTWMQRYTTPTRTAIIFAMEPVSAALFGVFVANEHLTPLQLLGGGLIVAAMVLAEYKSGDSPSSLNPPDSNAR